MMIEFKKLLIGALFATLSLSQSGFVVAQNATTIPGLKVRSEESIDGRKVIQYEHDNDPAWRYNAPQKDMFCLVVPRKVVKAPPLCVVLHTAGKTGGGRQKLPKICKPEDRGLYGDDTFYVLCLDCGKNKKIDWWWGGHAIKKSPDAYKQKLTPTEARLIATVNWVISKNNIDPSRVYLNGTSMGGSGSLGLGFIRGDLFAAINVVVPAGVEHFTFRTANTTFPDPPPVFNISSQKDKWALNQEALLAFCLKKKYALAFAWGPFGHKGTVKGSEANSGVYDFPWLSIRKNEAYPVFTQASTDHTYPGQGNLKMPDQKGQINGYFRWKNIKDEAEEFVMELRLVKTAELKQTKRPIKVPLKSSASITLRRLQKFVVTKGAEFNWSMNAAGKVLQSGVATADETGLLTISALNVSDEVSSLRIVPSGK